MMLNNSNKYWNLVPTILITFLVFFLFGLFQTLVLFLCATIQDVEVTANLAYMHLGIISSLSSIVGLLSVYVFIKIKTHSIKDYLNLFLPKINTVMPFVLLAICFMVAMEYISNIYPEFFYSDFVIESYRQSKNLPLFYLGVVLLGPIFEEVLFRGFLFKGIEKSSFGSHGAVFISAILFSIVHIQYGVYILLFMMFPIALLLGYARLKSGSLILPILIHMINNLATCVVTHLEVY